MSQRNNTGFKNEENFRNFLNQKKYSGLSGQASDFVSDVCPQITDDSIINVEKIAGRYKPDVKISVDSQFSFVSLKEGDGNSVHQEPIFSFIEYCITELGMDEATKDCFLWYFFGDGTTDGTGPVESRKSARELALEHPDRIKTIQSFLVKHSRILFERFLVYGVLGPMCQFQADYILHGHLEKNDSVWAPMDCVMDFLVGLCGENVGAVNSNNPSLGPLSLQTWGRNLSGKEGKDSHRFVIQVKWSACQKQLEAIQKRLKEEKCRQQEEKRSNKIGDNSHGFKNQTDIAKYLNGKRVRLVEGGLSTMISHAFRDVAQTEIISAKKYNNKIKPTIAITAGGVTKNIKISSGKGNSVHQENFLEFLSFCKSCLGMTNEEELSLRRLFYADGTIDGKGKIEDRLDDSKAVRLRYPDETYLAQGFFNRNRNALINRFLVQGKDREDPSTDYFYHGNYKDGVTIPVSYLVDYMENEIPSDRALLSVGGLRFQMWNRNIEGDSENEYKRNDIQIKWPDPQKTINNALVKYNKIKQDKQVQVREGLAAEYDLVASLNMNRNATNVYWDFIYASLHLRANQDYYAVRVCHKIFSELLGKAVFPKADVYICTAEIPEGVLENNGYWLDEDFLEENGIEYQPIPGSGISVKHPDASKITYSKISSSSFEKMIGNKLFGLAASVFVKEKDIHLNLDVIKGWHLSEVDFVGWYNNQFRLFDKQCDSVSSITIDEWLKIKKWGMESIQETIKQNKEVRGRVFSGEGVFPEPYAAHFIYEKRVLSTKVEPDSFMVTTGSGRHSGKYTIAIKPKVLLNVSKSRTDYGTVESHIEEVAEKNQKKGHKITENDSF